MGLAKLFNCGKCGRNLGEPSSSTIYLHKKYGYCHRVCPKRPRKPKQGRIGKAVQLVWGLGVDVEATLARKFQDGASKVMRDGREKLEGEDYTARVREVLARDGGKCQWEIAIQRRWVGMAAKCGASADDVDHIVKRSDERDDRASNLRSLCRAHHDLRHKEFQTRFSGSKR